MVIDSKGAHLMGTFTDLDNVNNLTIKRLVGYCVYCTSSKE